MRPPVSRSRQLALALLGTALMSITFTATVFAQAVLMPSDSDANPQRAHEPDALKARSELVRQSALNQLRQLGGKAAAAADKWSKLSTQKLIERLALQPPVGPSIFAAPRRGASPPAPAVNNTGPGGGATIGDPGVVMLLAQTVDQGPFGVRCTATLIRPNVLLSASHCMCNFTGAGNNYPTGAKCENGDPVTAPSPLLNPKRWLAFFQYLGVRQVSKVVIDDQYEFDSTAVKGDVALLILQQPVAEIIPAALPTSNIAAPIWNSGTVEGFGYSAGPGAAQVLQQLVGPGIKALGPVNQAKCTSQSYLDPNAVLCSTFGTVPGGSPTTICNGDSGGPLIDNSDSGNEIGVNSGRDVDNCAAPQTMAFQMSTSYQIHYQWIQANAGPSQKPPGAARWPAFGQNLRYILDKRQATPFDTSGSFSSDSWITSSDSNPVLATINSSGRLLGFSLQTRDGKTICTGHGGDQANTPNVDYCSASITPGTQYHVVAKGTANETLQYVVTAHNPGTTFDQ